MNTLEEMEKRLEENEKQAEEKERQAKEMEAEAVINQINADVERMRQISQKDKWWENAEDKIFVESKNEECYIEKKESRYAYIRKEDIAKLIRTLDGGAVHKKMMAEGGVYAESVKVLRSAGSSYNPSGLEKIESKPTGREYGHPDFFLQNILSLSEPDFIHYVDNLYRKNEDGTEDRNKKIVLKPETIKRFKVLRENKELANQLIEAFKTAENKKSQAKNEAYEQQNIRIGLIVLGVVIAIIVAIIVKCVA